MTERAHIALTEAQIVAAEKGELQLETREGKKVEQLVWNRHPFNQRSSSVLVAVLSDGEKKHYYKSGCYYSDMTMTDRLDLFVSEEPSILVSGEQNQFAGYLKGVPPEIIEQMLIEQEARGNKRDASVFDKKFDASANNLGFQWSLTKLGFKGWLNVSKGDYTNFYEMYGKPDEPDLSEPKPLYEVGEIIEVREVDISKWLDVEYRGGKNGQVAVWDGFCMDIFGEGNHRKKQTEKTVMLENKVMTVTEAIEYLTNIYEKD